MSRPKQNLICNEVDCERPAKSRGLCGTHYIAWYRKQHRVINDTGRPPADLSHPAVQEFLYKLPPYIREFRCRRDMPLYELQERGIAPHTAPVRAQGGGWVDAGHSGRYKIQRDFTPKEGGVVDWSNR